MAFGWSAGLSVQLSRLLGLDLDSAVGDASMGGPLLAPGTEMLC